MNSPRFYNPQFDLFIPTIVDLRFRDQQHTMERPFFSLSKAKRLKPIEYRNEKDGIFVTVQPHQDYGMATIWDADILIWAASVLCDMKHRGCNDISREIKFQPHDLLKAIGRSTGGKDYGQLRAALERLKSTVVTTNIRAKRGQKRTMFSWIDQWDDLIDSHTKESRGLSLTVSDWFYRGVLDEGGLLSIDPAYFGITGGRERWLYRVARKHAGGNGGAGFAIGMPTLFEKSGVEGTYRRFKFEILRIAQRNDLPAYALSTREGIDGEPVLQMVRRDPHQASMSVLSRATAKEPPVLASPARQPATASAPPPLLRPVFYQLSDQCLARIRKDFPEFDVYALKADFDAWLYDDPARTPSDYEAAFYGFARKRRTLNHV